MALRVRRLPSSDRRSPARVHVTEERSASQLRLSLLDNQPLHKRPQDTHGCSDLPQKHARTSSTLGFLIFSTRLEGRQFSRIQQKGDELHAPRKTSRRPLQADDICRDRNYTRPHSAIWFAKVFQTITRFLRRLALPRAPDGDQTDRKVRRRCGE